VKVLQPAFASDDCGSACVELSPHCILKIGVEDVVSAALQMLDNQHSAKPEPPASRTTLLSARLLQAHSAEAMRRALEALRSDSHRPSL
jgi:hypothetical protein